MTTQHGMTGKQNAKKDSVIKSAQLTTFVEPELKERVQRVAKANGVTVSKLLEYLIEQNVKG
jgi:antitoxin component of RelBE/YafQ-DinJ toxin-antitoxin module